ncbi:MAG: beta-phosphoglucomutase [Eubacteriales bacterium]|nr:beta-phosphoglucomutase [Eubacteriales bacterium]
MPDLIFSSEGYNKNLRLKNETLFHVASGRLGVRGCFEEGAPEGAASVRGCYINGFCETEPITYNEKLYGFPESKQQIVNLPDAQSIRIYDGGKAVVCWEGEQLRQVMDMKNGVYERSFIFPTANGRLSVRFTRLVSFIVRNLFAVECTVSALEGNHDLRIISELNGNVKNFTAAGDPRVASGSGEMLNVTDFEQDNGSMSVTVETKNSRRRMRCDVSHDFAECTVIDTGISGFLASEANVHIEKGESFTFHKYAIYSELGVDEPTGTVCDFAELREGQRRYLESFWRHARVKIGGDEELQSQLDFCLWGMLCSAGRDGITNVAAKGLSGEGYEGHYFWDSEIYVLPFFLNTEPEIAKALLTYRYRQLDHARAHARIMGHESGALYPWRTITGSECSSHYPSGSAQYHINGDIAGAFLNYWNLTHDTSFLPETVEVLAETARLWLDVGHWLDGSFRIDGVTGPDEYTCIVNNNYYTNCCAANNLLGAVRLCGELEKLGALDALKEKISLTDEELYEFRRAGEGMYYPHDEALGIIAQDDSFLKKKRWDLSSIPKENFPLLMHYHPLQINRCQVLKQADSVLANFLYREEDVLTMMRSFVYYEGVTTHDSSLSNCIYSVMAARLGETGKAYSYLQKSIGIDTRDENGNTRDGLHIANMGGAYSILTFGFGGLRISDEGLSLFPIIPKELGEVSFPLYYRDRYISVTAKGDSCTLRVTEGDALELSIYGERITVTCENVTVCRKVKGVLFDLDGVVTDTAKFHYQAWKRIADELGVYFDEVKNEQFKGVSRAACLKLLLEWGNISVTAEEFEELLVRKNEYYRELLKSLTEKDVLPGIKEAIGYLREKHIPCALFSVSKNTDAILAYIGMTDAFDALVTGNDIANSKPHFEGYLLGAERIGVDHRSCVMIEDSEAGVRGAKNIAMKAIAIMPENKANADLCIDSTAKLNAALEKLI